MPSLYLHPANPIWQPAGHNSVLDTLRDAGLIGPPTARTDTDEFLAGDRFMQRVMFLGCSPQLVLEPSQVGDGQQLCSIRLRRYKEVRFLCSTRHLAVRCDGCRAHARLSDPELHDAVYRCEKCGRESLYSDLDWRQGAGFGCFFIEINGVYPHEAVPSDALLNGLGVVSNCCWKYFYMQD